jgi:hypothetical protein
VQIICVPTLIRVGDVQVGPNTWLGRAWVMNPVEGWYPTDVPEPFAPAVDIARTLNNATFMAGLATVGFEGPFSGPTMAGGTYPTPVRCDKLPVV